MRISLIDKCRVAKIKLKEYTYIKLIKQVAPFNRFVEVNVDKVFSARFDNDLQKMIHFPCHSNISANNFFVKAVLNLSVVDMTVNSYFSNTFLK